MLVSSIPAKIPVPFGASGGRNVIPIPSQVTITPGAASFTDGFPPLTRTAQNAGGVGPSGLDMNGILYDLSAWINWQNAGGPIYYDSAFATEVGGYPSGAVLASATTPGKYWLSIADNNTTNPDTGGANWVTGYASSGTLLNVRVYASHGTYAYTATTGTNSVIAEVLGAGGGGGGAPAPTGGSSYVSVAGGGGSGAPAKGRFTSGFSSLTITVGQGGIGGNGTTGGGTIYVGANGTSSSFGSLLTAPGGYGGTVSPNVYNQLGGFGQGAGVSSGGNIYNATGNGSIPGFCLPSGGGFSGPGANSIYGGGGIPVINMTGNGGNAVGPGAGGAGALSCNNYSPAAVNGGNGADGMVIVWEFS